LNQIGLTIYEPLENGFEQESIRKILEAANVCRWNNPSSAEESSIEHRCRHKLQSRLQEENNFKHIYLCWRSVVTALCTTNSDRKRPRQADHNTTQTAASSIWDALKEWKAKRTR
jgi:hypothetical protein